MSHQHDLIIFITTNAYPKLFTTPAYTTPEKLYTTNRNLRRVYTAAQDIIRYHTTVDQDPNRFDTNTKKIPTDFVTKPPTKILNNFTFSATKAPEDCAQRPNAGAGPTSSRGFSGLRFCWSELEPGLSI